jgi:hypothetical protein
MSQRRVFAAVGTLIVVAIIGLGSWNAPTTWACSCPPPLDPEEAIVDADYVFAGEVADIGNPDSDNYLNVSFRVSEAWKGVDHQEISIGTAADGDACGYSFSEGSTYLVYARDNQARYGPDLVTGICNRTDSLSLADDDLRVLGTGTESDDLEPGQQGGDGLDTWVLFGSIALFLAIVVAITLLRRWK